MAVEAFLGFLQGFRGAASIIFVALGLWALIFVGAPYALSGRTSRHIAARLGLVLSVLVATMVQGGIYVYISNSSRTASGFDLLEGIWLVEAALGLAIVFWSAYKARSGTRRL